MNDKVKSVKEIRKLIDEVVLPGFSYKTNFSSSDFLVDFGQIIIKARLVRREDIMKYEFVLDTQFLQDAELSYEEIVMVEKIINILENNRNFVLLRLKKYSVKEYEEEQEENKKSSEMMLEAFKIMMCRNMERQYNGDE